MRTNEHQVLYIVDIRSQPPLTHEPMHFFGGL